MQAPSFIESYVSTMEAKDSYAPKNFHRPIALWTMASCVGRQAYLKIPTGAIVYPGIYMLLVAASGSGKGAYKVASSKVINQLYPEKSLWNQTSFEFLSGQIVKNDGALEGAMSYDEFGDILAACNTGSKDYRLNNLLLTMFETGATMRIGYKNNEASGVEDKPVTVDSSISIMGCIPPDEFRELIGGRATHKGLMPRFLTVVADKREKKYRWNEGAGEKDYYNLCNIIAKKVPEKRTEFVLSDHAREYIEVVFNDVIEASEECPADASALNRIPAKTLKIAILNAVDQERPGIIEGVDVHNAYEFVLDCTRCMISRALRNANTGPEKVRFLHDEITKRGGEIPLTHAYDICKVRSRRDLNDIIAIGEDMQLFEVTISKTKSGRNRRTLKVVSV